ncbi:MAG: hypothetical protein AABW64_04675 [Nanoarchaeota archaeon]
MKTILLLQQLEKYPLFTFNEFVRLTRKSATYCRTRVYRLKKQKLIFEIEKGKYTVHDDPLIFSSHILSPSYISFWTALRYYNLTEQLPLPVMVASPRSKKNISFRHTTIVFYKTKHVWGYTKTRYGLFDIFMADAEKSIIDCLLSNTVPFAEIVKAISSPEIDVEKLQAYALKTKNNSLIKRIGYLLEQRAYNAEKLQAYLDYNYVPLDPSGRKKGQKHKKWRILDNT